MCVKCRCLIHGCLGNFRRQLYNIPQRNSFSSSSDIRDVFDKFPPAYYRNHVENGKYSLWEGSKCFQQYTSSQKSISMVLPPPNVTGTLHLGHALTATIQDIVVRWYRMNGHPVVWIPGMDHAGIATQTVVERYLQEEKNLTRQDLGKDAFINEVWKWKETKSKTIRKQLCDLGLSLDWSQEVFTLDQQQAKAVVQAFIKLFDGGLIYRGSGLVNWSCALQSVISDIEVNYKDVIGSTFLTVPGHEQPVEFGVLTEFAYKLNNSDEEIVVSTSRVETLLGDTAVAVNPNDPRYTNLIGKQVWHPFREETIPIISDTSVDPSFGTGAVKITPGHSVLDYKIGKKNNLKIISIISEDGTYNEDCGKYKGLPRFDGRKILTEELKKQNLLRGIKPYNSQVPICSRSGDIVELLVKPQWYIDCSKMAENAVSAVKNGDLKLEPSRFEKVWFHWLENISDWCISRQLWWGHRIPIYECWNESDTTNRKWVAAENKTDAQNKAVNQFGLSEIGLCVVQEEDVLDTWFSSAIYPFSVFGWPEKTENFKKNYPLTLMETGHDILFFWVSRMVMLGVQLTGKLPFDRIFLHGIICDAYGRKMSKSIGNIILPEDVITGITLEELQKKTVLSHEAGLISEDEMLKSLEGQKKLFPQGIPECGADALRFTLCSQNIQNEFINFDVKWCHNNRFMCNKIWQACCYTLRYMQDIGNCDFTTLPRDLSTIDRWILSRLATMVININKSVENMQLHTATYALRNFVYSDFCDFFLEATKVIKSNNSEKEIAASGKVLFMCLNTLIHSLSPFMPFLSEDLYQKFAKPIKNDKNDILMLAPYPTSTEWAPWKNEELEAEVVKVLKVITTIRRLFRLCNISKHDADVLIVGPEFEIHENYKNIIKHLAKCVNVFTSAVQDQNADLTSVRDVAGLNCTVFVSFKGMVKTSDIKDSLHKRYKKILREEETLLKLISSDKYQLKASESIKQTNSEKLTTLQEELKLLKDNIDHLSKISERAVN